MLLLGQVAKGRWYGQGHESVALPSAMYGHEHRWQFAAPGAPYRTNLLQRLGLVAGVLNLGEFIQTDRSMQGSHTSQIVEVLHCVSTSKRTSSK
jgi:hypothetical protein